LVLVDNQKVIPIFLSVHVLNIQLLVQQTIVLYELNKLQIFKLFIEFFSKIDVEYLYSNHGQCKKEFIKVDFATRSQLFRSSYFRAG